MTLGDLEMLKGQIKVTGLWSLRQDCGEETLLFLLENILTLQFLKQYLTMFRMSAVSLTLSFIIPFSAKSPANTEIINTILAEAAGLYGESARTAEELQSELFCFIMSTA